MPEQKLWLPDALDTLLEAEAGLQKEAPGRLGTRAVIAYLTGECPPGVPATRRVCEALRALGGGTAAEVAQAAGVTEVFARETLRALEQLRVNGARTGPGVVVLEEIAGSASWRLAA